MNKKDDDTTSSSNDKTSTNEIKSAMSTTEVKPKKKKSGKSEKGGSEKDQPSTIMVAMAKKKTTNENYEPQSDVRPAIVATDAIMKNMQKQLMDFNPINSGHMKLNNEHILQVLDKVKQQLGTQRNMAKLHAPVHIVGDIHGQFVDLKRIFNKLGLPPKTSYLFLGDYVDRGPNSLETIMLLFCLKAQHPDHVTLLRGNHECMNVNRVYGFFAELEQRDLLDLYPEMNDVFDWLPICALVDHKVLCMHGGISKLITSFKDINHIPRPLSMIPPDDSDIALDLLWADPLKSGKGYMKSPRGVSYMFGMDVLDKFCKDLKLTMIVRGHQVVHKGYQKMGLDAKKPRLVTVFSAPNYCGEMDNDGAVMILPKNHRISFHIIESNANDEFKEREKIRLTVPMQEMYPEMDETQKSSLAQTSKSFKKNQGTAKN